MAGGLFSGATAGLRAALRALVGHLRVPASGVGRDDPEPGETEPGRRYDGVIPSPDGAHILLEGVGSGWALPHVYCETGWIADAVGALQTQFRDRYAVDVFVLGPLSQQDAVTVCELELISSYPGDPGRAEWMEPASEAAKQLPANQLAAVEAWRAGRTGPTALAPWQQRGWFAEAREWMLSAAKQAGAAIDGPVYARKGAWNGSCVLQAESSEGPLYFKASPARLPGEPRVIRQLSQTWPRNLPPLLDGDESRCWTLMRNVPGDELDPGDTGGLADALRLMSRIQVAESGNAGKWLEIGCPDRRLERLSASLERLLIGIPALLNAAGVISPAERDEVGHAVSPARELCRRLAEAAPAAAGLHHEDFRAGNVRRTPAGDIVILDWNDVVVAHPFFSAQRMLYFVDLPEGCPPYHIGNEEADQPRRILRDAYLEAFAPFAECGRLTQMFQWSLTLAPVYDAFRFAESADVEAAIREGLDADQSASARNLIASILESFREAAGEGAQGPAAAART